MKICEYDTVIAIAEMSAGNETVGVSYLRSKTFTKKNKIEDVIEWAKDIDCTGKLILTLDEDMQYE